MSQNSIRVIDEGETVRLDQNGSVLSHLSKTPAATHTLFDLLAAAIHAFSKGRHVAVLGFAAGGLAGPLRAMGGDEILHGVDLDPNGERLFRRHAADWAGDVRLERRDALEWLLSRRRRFDAILEDLSIPVRDDVEKPSASLDELPRLAAARLAPSGVYLANLFPPLPGGWAASLARVRASFLRAYAVLPDDYHNRIVIAGDLADSPRNIRGKLNAALDLIRSEQANAFAVRRCGHG